MALSVSALAADADFEMALTALTDAGLGRPLTDPRIQKPGLALAGYVASVRPGSVQVVGRSELSYLRALPPQARAASLTPLLAAPIAAVVVAEGEVPEELLHAAVAAQCCVLITTHDAEVLIHRLHSFLDEHLGPEMALHAVLLDVLGVGVLLRGKSGVGKSECALDLIMRGARLVADDVVHVKQKGRQLVGMGPELTQHHMELRGLGIINVQDLFGAAAVRERKRIELLVELREWDQGPFDRTGINPLTEDILGVDVPKVVLPIRPGRNMAAIVEVAARNHLLKLQGTHSALAFEARMEERMRRPPREVFE
jgi:HPr kinase/phosphorylase